MEGRSVPEVETVTQVSISRISRQTSLNPTIYHSHLISNAFVLSQNPGFHISFRRNDMAERHATGCQVGYATK